MQLRLHRQPEGIGTVTEGLLAVADDGVIIAANTAALTLLGWDRTAIGRCTVEQALAVELSTLLAGCGRGGSVARALQRDDGSPLWLRVDLGRSTFSVGPSRAATAAAAQPGATQALICRARRVLDKPIALLLQGESGVGKELFARACHESGPRRGKPWVAVNCAALPENLIEAELFGYRPGAFTGAGRDGAPGRLREAEGGTLFLDEIGDMPLAMQARLLRVLQERQVQPLGGGKPVPVNFQLICAAHRKLRAEVDAGRFREDLYYRINGLALQLPPLRERGDLVGLVAAVLRELAPGRPVQLAPELMAGFAAFRWPGNLRQLSNALRTACALLGDDETVIDLSHLPDDLVEDLSLRAPPSLRSDTSECDLRQQAAHCVREAVSASNGNLSEAARRLGVSRNTLYRKLRQQA
jgi:transcriptional regulator of acetoin/glycerol metabolism